MTRNKKLVLAGALAGLIGTTALAGFAVAHPEGSGVGNGYFGQMMGGYGPGYGPGRHMDGYGPRGGDHMWGGEHMWGGRPGPRGAFGASAGPRGMIMGNMFEQADADKDGKLTQAEIDTYRDAQFARYDTNSDGKLTLDEFEGLLQEITKPLAVRAFQMHDPDGDAAITKDEFDRPTAGLVERLDRDGDGALSRNDRPQPRWAWGHMRHDDDDDGNNGSDDK